MAHDYDVIVAGGGPAGSSTANFLRQRGRSVLVLERERFPRFHIGESLLPLCNDVWRELGVFERMDGRYQHKPGAHFVHEESGAEFIYHFDSAIRPGNPYAFQVKRAEFDLMLLERAIELGADVRQETRVEDVEFDADGVTVRASGGLQARAKVFVDATGRDALMAGRRALKEPDELVTTNCAVHTMYAGVQREAGPDGGNIVLGLFDGGWWWLIPFADGDTSCGMVFEKSFTKIRRGAEPAELMDGALPSLPHLRARLGGARRILPVGAQGNWSYRARRFYDDRLLLVGDAAAFVDPLFSTGVLFAVQGARFAAEHLERALADGDFRAERFAGYQEQCAQGMDIFKSLVHEFYGKKLRELLLGSARHPTICAVITSMLAGDVYKPSLWHASVRRGFSHLVDAGGVPGVRSSRQAKPREIVS